MLQNFIETVIDKIMKGENIVMAVSYCGTGLYIGSITPTDIKQDMENPKKIILETENGTMILDPEIGYNVSYDYYEEEYIVDQNELRYTFS